MRLLVLAFMFIGYTAFAQTEQEEEKSTTQILEVSCGQCNFGLNTGGCSLAVKIDGKAYPVDGSNLFDHGDPHADHGMCNVVRKAEVSGEVKRGRFKATSFVLLPLEESDAE